MFLSLSGNPRKVIEYCWYSRVCQAESTLDLVFLETRTYVRKRALSRLVVRTGALSARSLQVDIARPVRTISVFRPGKTSFS